ncbi:MAG: hypothetical protein CSYNP_02819 [Syntrophus sp. SKADARSKE-3]|nr:hypothetical protein [Syntrophus sp. SKADARSKE-3]
MTYYRRVKGVSDFKKPRVLGQIKLGYRDNQRNGAIVETDCFICPPEVQAVYGERTKELRIRFPFHTIEENFSQSLRLYNKSHVLLCIGNGEEAGELQTDKSRKTRPCPCEKKDEKKCSLVGDLSFILPDVSEDGIYKIYTKSFNSVISLNEALEKLKKLEDEEQLGPGKKIRDIDLKLVRVGMSLPFKGGKRTHYPLNLVHDFCGKEDISAKGDDNNTPAADASKEAHKTNSLPAQNQQDPAEGESSIPLTRETAK